MTVYLCGNSSSIASSKAGSRVEFCLKERRKRRQNIDLERVLLSSLRFLLACEPVKQSLITRDCFKSYARGQNCNDGVHKLRKGAKSQVTGGYAAVTVYLCGNSSSIASSKAGSRVEFCLKEGRKRRQNIDIEQVLFSSLRFLLACEPLKQSLITRDCFTGYAWGQNRNDRSLRSLANGATQGAEQSWRKKGAKSQVRGSKCTSRGQNYKND